MNIIRVGVAVVGGAAVLALAGPAVANQAGDVWPAGNPTGVTQDSDSRDWPGWGPFRGSGSEQECLETRIQRIEQLRDSGQIDEDRAQEIIDRLQARLDEENSGAGDGADTGDTADTDELELTALTGPAGTAGGESPAAAVAFPLLAGAGALAGGSVILLMRRRARPSLTA